MWTGLDKTDVGCVCVFLRIDLVLLIRILELECEIFRILLKHVRDHLSVLFIVCMTVTLI